MGTVYKKTYTKAVPAGTEIFLRKGERFARWSDAKGKVRIARVTVPEKGDRAGQDRIILESPYYVAKYRDGNGIVREVSTHCRSERGAHAVLTDLQRRAENVRSKLITAAEDKIADHQATPLSEQFDAFDVHLASKGVTDVHRKTTLSYLRRLAADCCFGRLCDLKCDSVERWLNERTADGMSARSRNAHLAAIVTFANWCARSHRLLASPFAGIAKANEKTDPRRQRRSLTEPELLRLLEVARQRPLLDAATVRRGKRKGEVFAELRAETRERLEWLGRERALIYKTLLLTGLRKGELASLTVAQLHLDVPVAFAVLDAADEKNREGSTIAIRSDLADDLGQWLKDKLERLQREAVRSERQSCLRMTTIPTKLPPDAPLFNVPRGLVRILDRDLVLAGIARKVKVNGKWRIDKRDERGRSIDVHAMRTTFGTLLSRGGVPLRTAQAAMRHSDPSLTANVYTDPKLLDVYGALDSLPLLPLGSDQRQREAATGTEGNLLQLSEPLAPTLAPTVAKRGTSEYIADKRPSGGTARPLAATAEVVKRNDPLTTAVNGSSSRGDKTAIELFVAGIAGWEATTLTILRKITTR